MNKVYLEVYLALMSAACIRLKERYVTGIFRWADSNRKELSRKEQTLAKTLTILAKSNANPKAYKAVLDQWEDTVGEIITEWERMIRRL